MLLGQGTAMALSVAVVQLYNYFKMSYTMAHCTMERRDFLILYHGIPAAEPVPFLYCTTVPDTGNSKGLAPI